MNQDPEVMRFFPNTLTAEETKGLIERLQKHFDEYGFTFYAVDHLADGEFIGFLGLVRAIFESSFTPCNEIGWRLRKEYWGQGLATEGAKACLDYGFSNLGFNEVYSFTATINPPSENVMKKLRMTKVGEFDHPKLAMDSPLLRHVLYKITKAEHG
ncbi:UNVERIFIED_CONTAM: hypothetical protein GTU68_009560 [Idotea baltica]|nr:hypothetical protein [Idotea baltica]